jgi:hypothetical protein
LALAIAPLVAKAAEHFGDALQKDVTGDLTDRAARATGEAGWNLLGQMAVRIRQWFQRNKDEAGTKAVDVVLAAPDSQKSTEKLAEVLKDSLAHDDAFRAELQELFDKAKSEPGEVGRFAVQVYGNARVGKIQQFETVNTQTFNA